VLLASGYLLVLAAIAGCQQKMADQPSYKQLQACKFFADDRSERPAVAGTVARGHLPTDIALMTGRRTGKNGEPMGANAPAVIQPPPGSPAEEKARKARYDQFVDKFPFAMTEAVLQHGRDRFMIYCVVCHDPLGTGQGKIVERGYTAPPSYHIERLRSAPVGHLYAVINEGYGSMPSHGAQVPVRDRWAIVGYLRALQASQHFPEAKVTDEMRQNSPLPLGEGQGVRAASEVTQHSTAGSASRGPHPNPLPKGERTSEVLPKGEGTEQQANAVPQGGHAP
jgi:mono/diheme cytochrome c family protein